MKLAAVVSCPTGVAHTYMAAEALRRTAAAMGHEIVVETHGSIGTAAPLTSGQIAEADAVVLATDVAVERERFAGKPVHEVAISDAIVHTRAVIDAALALARPAEAAPAAYRAEAEAIAAEVIPATPATPAPTTRRLVAITACPTGIAHTFMAAESLQKAARALGYGMRVETQGSVGAKSQLTPREIADADAVVIAADTGVDRSRFAGKPVYVTSTKAAIHDGQAVIRSALEQPAHADAPTAGPAAEHARAAEQAPSRTGPYKHLMTGVSYMLPVVIAGGLAIALAFALGGIYAGDQEGTVAWALNQIGGGTAFQLFVAVLSGFIAYSIADRPGLAPGFIGGMLAHTLGAGFLGGIVSGFLAGYLTKFLADRIRLPSTLEGLKPVLILPFLGTITVGLLMIYVIAPPVQALNEAMNGWLLGMRGSNAALLGLLLGGMMAADMGGPVNKAAYTFGVGLLGADIQGPMAAVMAAGMTPPLALALASFAFRSRFDAEERKAGGPAFVLGLSFISEGAIPFAAKDPLRVIPALVLGSAAAGALSMMWGVGLRVPHGGIFAAVIPGAVTRLPAYLAALAIGTVLSALALFVLKRPLRAPDPA